MTGEAGMDDATFKAELVAMIPHLRAFARSLTGTVDADDLAPGSHKLSPRVDLPPALEVTRKAPDVVTLQISGRGGR